MEVGPTCHYVMGGVEVEPDTAAAVGVPGLFAAALHVTTSWAELK